MGILSHTGAQLDFDASLGPAPGRGHDALNKRWHSVREGRQIRLSGPNRTRWRMCARPCCGAQQVRRSSWLISSYPRERAVLDIERIGQSVQSLCAGHHKKAILEGEALNWLECRLLPPEMAESVRRRPSHDRVFPFGHVASLPPKGYRTVAGLWVWVVRFCELTCRYSTLNSTGAFASTGIEGGSANGGKKR